MAAPRRKAAALLQPPEQRGGWELGVLLVPSPDGRLSGHDARDQDEVAAGVDIKREVISPPENYAMQRIPGYRSLPAP